MRVWCKGHLSTVDGNINKGSHCGQQESPHDIKDNRHIASNAMISYTFKCVKLINEETNIALCSLNYCSIHL